MIPDPLHPAVVHFPIVLALLLPIGAAVALWRIRRGAKWRPAWVLPVALAAALSLSTWFAVQTGGAQEDRVENVVPDKALDAHEEAAELMLTLSSVLLVVTAVGFAPGVIGKASRYVATAGAVGLVAAAMVVGHSGGQLVYKYNAASAYTGQGGGVAQAPSTAGEHDH